MRLKRATGLWMACIEDERKSVGDKRRQRTRPGPLVLCMLTSSTVGIIVVAATGETRLLTTAQRGARSSMDFFLSVLIPRYRLEGLNESLSAHSHLCTI